MKFGKYTWKRKECQSNFDGWLVQLPYWFKVSFFAQNSGNLPHTSEIDNFMQGEIDTNNELPK